MLSVQQITKYLFGISYYLALGYFSILMILITVQYIPIDYSAAFLNLKEEAITKLHYKIAFFSHVYTSIFVLLIGITQFSAWLRTNYSAMHRSLGKIYIGLILLIASPSGLVMAVYANGGFGPQISFTIQAILWFIFTLLAYKYARKKEWHRHRSFMFRSYALTLSAVSLRLFKWGIVHVFELPPMDTYRIVAWLGWLVNIAIIEIYLFRTEKK